MSNLHEDKRQQVQRQIETAKRRVEAADHLDGLEPALYEAVLEVLGVGDEEAPGTKNPEGTVLCPRPDCGLSFQKTGLRRHVSRMHDTEKDDWQKKNPEWWLDYWKKNP